MITHDPESRLRVRDDASAAAPTLVDWTSAERPVRSRRQALEVPVIDDFEELVRLVTDRPGLFLRYSKGPDVDAEDGPSRDYEAGVAMPGLSVTTIGPEDWWSRPVADWVSRRICKYAELGEQEDRFPWLLTGRVVGHGPDHEPLVVDVTPVGRIGRTALDEAKRLYAERFDVGRDSRE